MLQRCLQFAVRHSEQVKINEELHDKYLSFIYFQVVTVRTGTTYCNI
jgi:hypothetical protein